MMPPSGARTISSQPFETDFELLRSVVETLKIEAREIERFSSQVPTEMARVIRLMVECKGSVIVSGIGKAGWIGQKISATLASTGTRSHFLHAAEAVHGDFGRVDPEDIVLILSNSGETEEILRLLPTLRERGACLVGLTSREDSQLARSCDTTICYGRVEEACQMGLAPSTSTTLMLAIGDALALTVSRLKEFSPADFARFHPGGSLGRQLQCVDEVMRPLTHCRTTGAQVLVRQAISDQAKQGRRTGAVLVLDSQKRLVGIFTDSDLVRLLEKKEEHLLDEPIEKVMTRKPVTVPSGVRVDEAVQLLSSRCISELPVVDDSGVALGLIDITDVIA